MHSQAISVSYADLVDFSFLPPPPRKRGARSSRRLSDRARRILVVDDDTDTLEAVRHLVESYSPRTNCVCVSDPYEALELLAEQDFDFVLTDLRIPGLSGLSLLHQIDRQIDSDPLIAESTRFSRKVPVVLMSARPLGNLSLKRFRHFKVAELLDKRDLPRFLALQLAQ